MALERSGLDDREEVEPFKQDIYCLGMIACKIMAEERPTPQDIKERRI